MKPELVVMSLMALVMALGFSLFKPIFGLAFGAGFLILIMAFNSIQVALYLLILAMLFSPEVAVGTVQGRGVGGREVSFRLDDILLIVLGLSWLVKTVVYRELAFFKSTPVNRPILYYMLACIIATMIGILLGRVQWMTGMFFVIKYFEYFFVFFMTVNNVTTKKQAVGLVVMLLGTCFLITLFAIAQIPTGERATAPFEGESGEPNTLGGYLAFLMAVVIGLLLHIEKLPIRAALLFLLFCIGLGLMATLSRASYLGAVAMLLTVGATQWRRPGVVMVALLVIIMLPVAAPKNVKERVYETFYGKTYGGEMKIGGVAVDLSTTERIRSWQYVLKSWSHQPLFGHGVTGYAWADAQYVKILGETGLVGLVAFFFMIRRLWKTARNTFEAEEDPFCKGLAHGFLLGMVAVLFHAIGANSFIIIRIMEPFWLIAGLVMLIPSLPDKISLARPAVQAAA
jgi:O-antigen ligase